MKVISHLNIINLIGIEVSNTVTLILFDSDPTHANVCSIEKATIL